ncbi:hypothetical protein PpBr36_05440 [Pyricularia pennisetigena]
MNVRGQTRFWKHCLPERRDEPPGLAALFYCSTFLIC